MELESNYQNFKIAEIETIKRNVEKTTVDEKINAMEVADSHYDDMKINHSLILGHSMIRNVTYLIIIFIC